ncbi:MAG: hypothetical protein AMXMBFR23_05800 [Chloroflexota bacterium]
MAVEVTPGIWWLERTRGSNVYLIRTRDGSYVLVDPGFSGNTHAVVSQAREIADGAPVTDVLLTHGHFDHAAAAGAVAQALHARVRLGIGDCVATEDGWRVAPGLARRGRIRTDVRVDAPIERREEIAPGIEAVLTPGHTLGSTCFIAWDAGVSLVGDLVISHPDGLARSLAAANVDDREYLATLARFAEEDATPFGLAGHGHPVRSGFAEALLTLASQPRERGGLRARARRAVRLARFATWMAFPDRPPRR